MIEWGKDGYLEIIIGPMFSGKTSRLLTIKRQYEVCDISCCLVNHIDDKRYHETLASTHDMIMTESLNLRNLSFLYEKLDQYDVFLINEGQFFENLFDVVVKLVEVHKKKIYVCGLNGDYRRQRFGTILDLIPFCDNVTKLNALCKKCKNGTPGIFTHRISSEKIQKKVGSNDYIPLCRKCFLKNNLN